MSADATRKLVQDFYVAFKVRGSDLKRSLAQPQSGKMTDVLAFLTPDFLLAQVTDLDHGCALDLHQTAKLRPPNLRHLARTRGLH